MLKYYCLALVLLLHTVAAWGQTLSAQLSAIDTLFVHGQTDAAIRLLQQTEAAATGMTTAAQLTVARYAAAFYRENTEDDSTIVAKQKAVLERSTTLTPEDIKGQFDDYVRYAYVLYHHAGHKPLVLFFEENLPELERKYGQNSAETARFYSIYSLGLQTTGDYEKCNDYGDQSIRIAEKVGNEDLLITCYGNRALNLYYQGNMEESWKYRIKNIEILEQHPLENKKKLAQVYVELAETYSPAGKPEEALKWLEKAKPLYQELYREDDQAYYHLYLTYAYPYTVLNQLDKAIGCYEKMLVLRPGDILSNRGLARTCLRTGEYEKVHTYLDRVFEANHYTTGMDWAKHDNPRSFGKDLELKANAFMRQYAQSKDPALAEAAVQLFLEIRSLSRYNINRNYQTSNKQASYEIAIAHNNKAIEVLHELFEATAAPRYLALSFDFAEMNKSLLLYQALRQHREISKCTLPDVLKSREAEARMRIVSLEKNVFEQGNSPELQEQLFQEKKAYEQVKKEVDRQCKDYFKDVYFFPENNLAATQHYLDQQTTLLSFNVTEKWIFLYAIDHENAIFKKIAKNFPLNQWIKDFTAFICQREEGAGYSTNAAQYAQLGWQLYEKLVLPVEASLKNRVVIIPDGMLNVLPFEALLAAPAEKPERFHLHAYWGLQHAVSYSYSATLLRDMETPRTTAATATQKLLAIAPFADLKSELSEPEAALRGAFRPLPFSGEEAAAVARLRQGAVLKGEAATRTAVTKLLSSYQILHFATHAKANDQQGDFSFLVFWPEKGASEQPLLYVKDLYSMPLDAEMVVLSACETGIGELKTGEGTVGLARAFAHSGARSIVTTLWSVSDEKSKELMVYFYEFLAGGMTKDEALKRAKSKYLSQNTGSAAHPFFWSGFKLIGSRGALP